VDCIDETVSQCFSRLQLELRFAFFGLDADAVDHDKITAVPNKLMMK
jgi:hypothetical protein